MEKCRSPRAALVVELLRTLPESEGLVAAFFCFLAALEEVGVCATTFGEETSVEALEDDMLAAGRLMVLLPRLSAAAEALLLLLGIGWWRCCMFCG